MRIILLTICILTVSIVKSLSQNWNFTKEISVNSSMLLKGTIDSTYKITMFLQGYKGRCGKQYAGYQWQHKILSGYYLYDNYNIKIPLLGAISFGDNNESVVLYVPEDYTDTLITVDCGIKDFKEVFFLNDKNDLTQLNWTKRNSRDTLKVDLKYEWNWSNISNAFILLNINDIEIKRISLSELSSLKYIDNIDNFDSKSIDGEFYLTFKFGERSTPGGLGGGDCGAGYELYLGFIHLSKDLEIVKFETRFIDSCLYFDKIEKYKVIAGSPELGLLPIEN